ncbi:MAG TPA: D-alanyl-D-alanine carboxypeptidase/D-alanyl-D-alanine-endopeptidase, partial [Allosphingosinicella sp.]|nr:D-alanyl-D-alanine carboxypeptidase/D-alanyl-D-alanine-endopeptidase [Allosphingosinicella sp.]
MIQIPLFARATMIGLAIAAAAPALAFQQSLEQTAASQLAQAPLGSRFGLVVTDAQGRELIAINPDNRFIPASNTKLFTTAAAFAALPGLDQPDSAGGAAVRLVEVRRRVRDVVLVGHGDARLSSSADCVTNCLATLADAVAARTRRVRDVIGDDTLFPDQRWSPGMGWNNIVTAYGTGISALTLDDNEFQLRVTPAEVGQPPSLDELPYYRVTNQAVTVAEGETDLRFTRMPGSLDLRLTGRIAASAEPRTLRLGIDDPALYAAQRLRTLLEARGVRVTGHARARHRPAEGGEGEEATSNAPPPVAAEPELARVVPPPLREDLVRINKESQNLHAELMVRRLGILSGSGSIQDGVAVIATLLEQAGAPRTGWDLSDGSGMSTYNRMSPRAVARLLLWATTQSWGTAWRETFPVAAVDGTLANRFRGSTLERRLFAKTGSLNATNALSGYMTARSGQTLIFSFFANDVPPGG